MKGKCPDKMCQLNMGCMCEILLRPVSTSKGKNLMQKYGHHEHVSRLGTQFFSQTKGSRHCRRRLDRDIYYN